MRGIGHIPRGSIRLRMAASAALVAAWCLLFLQGLPGAATGGEAQPTETPSRPHASWTLIYAEDFSTPLNEAVASWIWDGYSKPFDTIMDDAGLWYRNDYGPAWTTALNAFATYRKEFRVGQDGWLTASLSARDWNRDGVIEAPPSITTERRNGISAAVLDVPDHTGGAIFRSTYPLPEHYRIEYTLRTIDFGGKRNGSLVYDGRVNGYGAEGCKTQHPGVKARILPVGRATPRRPTASGKMSAPVRTDTTDSTSWRSSTSPIRRHATTTSGTTTGRW